MASAAALACRQPLNAEELLICYKVLSKYQQHVKKFQTLSSNHACCPDDADTSPIVRPAFPVRLSSWRGRLRCGLVAMLASDAPAAGQGLAEVLMHDRERLHNAQNGFQQLIVLSAALLIIQQVRKTVGCCRVVILFSRKPVVCVVSGPVLDRKYLARR